MPHAPKGSIPEPGTHNSTGHILSEHEGPPITVTSIFPRASLNLVATYSDIECRPTNRFSLGNMVTTTDNSIKRSPFQSV
jgi:hypothetical protein